MAKQTKSAKYQTEPRLGQALNSTYVPEKGLTETPRNLQVTLIGQELSSLETYTFRGRQITQRLVALHARLTGAEVPDLSFPELELDQNNILGSMRRLVEAQAQNMDLVDKILAEIEGII